MPCDRALTITKAIILPEKLAALVTPQVAALVAKAVLADLGHGEARTQVGSGYATASAYPYTITIRGLAVTVTGGYDRAASRAIVEAIETALKTAAGMLFSTLVQQALAEMTGQEVTSDLAEVEDQGRVYQARILTVRI